MWDIKVSLWAGELRLPFVWHGHGVLGSVGCMTGVEGGYEEMIGKSGLLA